MMSPAVPLIQIKFVLVAATLLVLPAVRIAPFPVPFTTLVRDELVPIVMLAALVERAEIRTHCVRALLPSCTAVPVIAIFA
jgi:hypothetical protein